MTSKKRYLYFEMFLFCWIKMYKKASRLLIFYGILLRVLCNVYVVIFKNAIKNDAQE